MLAVILETADPERLYTGLSLIVSTASEGEPVRVLLGFGAAGFVPGDGEDPFTRTLAELWRTTFELCDVHACAATEAAAHPTISMPQFLREVAGARLVLV